VIFGPGARMLAGNYAKKSGARKVLVVTDPGVIAAGWTADVISTLEEADLPWVIFDKVSSNPRSEEVMSGAEFYNRENCNLIVAVGGGSPIDCAKGIGIVSSNKQHILSFEGVDKVTIPMPPLICLPTTGGSSADVSQFAIISNERAMYKIAIVSKALVPDLALIDPVTLTSMPSDLTACTGFDALSHAFESFVSIAHSPMTDLHSLEAIRLITSNLIKTLHDPGNVEFRGKVMMGSMFAGMAFSNASLGAIHAMSHSLGGLLDIPHGESNTLLLQHVVAFNFEEVPERYAKIGEAMGLEMSGKSSKEQKTAIVGKIGKLRKDAGIDRSLGQLGVSRDLIPELASKAMKDPCMVTNPRRPTQRDIEVIYEDCL
jgi:alcohol dehydrogenase